MGYFKAGGRQSREDTEVEDADPDHSGSSSQAGEEGQTEDTSIIDPGTHLLQS